MYFKRIKELRINFKKIQEDIAKKLKVNQSNYCRWENGKETIPLNKFNDLCNIYNINIDYAARLISKKLITKIKKKIDKKIVGNNIKYIRKKTYTKTISNII